MTRAERRRLEKAGARKEPVYTLTQTQINEIEEAGGSCERKEELKASISREIDERIQKEWAAREAALTGETDEEQILKVLCLLLAVPAKSSSVKNSVGNRLRTRMTGNHGFYSFPKLW